MPLKKFWTAKIPNNIRQLGNWNTETWDFANQLNTNSFELSVCHAFLLGKEKIKYDEVWQFQKFDSETDWNCGLTGAVGFLPITQ